MTQHLTSVFLSALGTFLSLLPAHTIRHRNLSSTVLHVLWHFQNPSHGFSPAVLPQFPNWRSRLHFCLFKIYFHTTACVACSNGTRLYFPPPPISSITSHHCNRIQTPHHHQQDCMSRTLTNPSNLTAFCSPLGSLCTKHPALPSGLMSSAWGLQTFFPTPLFTLSLSGFSKTF